MEKIFNGSEYNQKTIFDLSSLTNSIVFNFITNYKKLSNLYIYNYCKYLRLNNYFKIKIDIIFIRIKYNNYVDITN